MQEAIAQFVSFANARGLSPTLHLVSRIASTKQRLDRETALHYSLAGTVIHPHGFVLKRLVDTIQQLEVQPREFEYLMNEFWSSNTNVFGVARRAIAQLVKGDQSREASLLKRNIETVRDLVRPYLKLGSPGHRDDAQHGHEGFRRANSQD